MQTNPNDSTQAAPVSPDAPISPELLEQIAPTEAGQLRRGCRGWAVWVGLAVLLLLAIALIAAYSGYQSGIDQRLVAKATADAGEVYNQFSLAIEDIDNGRFELARRRLEWFRGADPALRTLNDAVVQQLTRQFDLALQDLQASRFSTASLRLEWIIEWDPGFPGVLDKLSEALYFSNVKATATPAPPTATPAITPTPDLRGVEEKYSAAQAALSGGNWTAAIDGLLETRKSDAAFQAVEIDGMLFIALRNRGVDKIFGRATTDPAITGVDLEGGMYDLALAERFGVLDAEARQYRRWAQWYVTGASYWEVDWAMVIDYFEDLVLEAPYLLDRSGYASIARYRDALVKYGDWLAVRSEWCTAKEQYQKALEITQQFNLGNYSLVEPTATYAGSQCESPQEASPTGAPVTEIPPAPSGEVTPTPEPPTPAPPTPEPTAAPTAYP